jgi:peptidoglycan-associated lipoprotein
MNRYVRLIIFITTIITGLASCGAGKTGRDAVVSHEIGEYYRAIEKYRKASRKEKDRAKRRDYAYAIAECYQYIGDYERAAMYYQNAIRRGYEEPEALFNLAEMQRNSQEYEEAIENYRMYLDLVPGEERARKGLEAIRQTQEWIENPTRHILIPLRK